MAWFQRQAQPSLPRGRRSLPLLGQTLAFHGQAHDEVCSLVHDVNCSTVRLSVLARDVALITSYDDALQVLDQPWSPSEKEISRTKAYEQLMAAFFSPPNLLLEDEDGEEAKEHRQAWDACMDPSPDGAQRAASSIVADWTANLAKQNEVDIYEACKSLGQSLALGTFLGLARGTTEFDDAQAWSEDMLRGQFSLPVGFKTPLYQNAFSRGQDAKRRFDAMVQQRMAAGSCPFSERAKDRGIADASNASHHAMFSSNLVVKAFASLAAALVLQLYRQQPGQATLAERIRSLATDEAEGVISAVVTETERVSPPIIGVMRTVVKDEGLSLHRAGVCIPRGWDAWPYLPLANRDEAAFGPDAACFRWDRYRNGKGSHDGCKQPLTFGAGVKPCGGSAIIRSWLRGVAMRLISSRISLNFAEEDLGAGVQDWLGWYDQPSNAGKRATWRGSVKQLPTQRPHKGILVLIAES